MSSSGEGLALIGAFVPVLLRDPESLAGGIEHALRVARLLAAVVPEGDRRAGPFIVVADDNVTDPGRTLHAGRITPEMALPDDEWAGYAGRAESVARAVREETGLRSVFHPHSAGWVETPAETDRFLAETDPEILGIVFDTGHYLFGAGDEGPSVVEALDRWADRVWYIHFKDNDRDLARRSRDEGWDYYQALRAGIFSELGKGGVDFAGGRALAGRAWLRRLGGRRAGHPARYGHSQRERPPQPGVPGVAGNLNLRSPEGDRVITRFARGDRVMESMETLGRQERAYHPMTHDPITLRITPVPPARDHSRRSCPPRPRRTGGLAGWRDRAAWAAPSTWHRLSDRGARDPRGRAQEARANIDVLVAPTFQTGSSHHHLPFGGTISLSTERYYGALRDMTESLIAEWLPPHLHRQWTRREPRAHPVRRQRPCLVACLQPRRRVVLGSRQGITRAACARFGRAPAGSCWRLRDLADHGATSGPGRQPTAPPHGRGAGADDPFHPLRFVPNVTASGRVSTAIPIARTRPARSGGSVCSRSSLPRSRQRSSALRACR